MRGTAGLLDPHRPVEQLTEHQGLAGPLLEALEVEGARGRASPRPASIAVTRPMGTKIRRRATTSTTRPSTRGAAVSTRSATTTSRTLPTRSPLGSKTVSPASLETYALVTVVTVAKATVGAVAGPDFLEYEVVDVFAPRAYAGNPLAVVFDADELTTEAVPGAGERVPPVGDVVHLRPTELGADYRVRIFTPFADLPFAGHPSVGAAHTLVRTGRLAGGTLRQECGVGVLDLVVDDDGATLTGGSPTLGQARSPEAIASGVGLGRRRRRRAPHMAGCGLPFTYLAVRPGAVDHAAPDGRARRARRRRGRLRPLLGRRHLDRLRPRVRRRPALGRGPGHRLGRPRHRRLAGRDRPAPAGRDVVLRRPAGREDGPPVGAVLHRDGVGGGTGGVGDRPGRRRADRKRSHPRAGVTASAGPPGRCTARGTRDVALMAVAVVGVSLSGPLTALVTAPMLAIAFWRNAAGAAAMLPVLLTRERATLTGLRRRDLRSSVVAGLFLAAHFAAWLPSLSMTTVAASIALVTTTPIWTAWPRASPVCGCRPRSGGAWCSPFAGAALIVGVDVTVSLEALAGDGLACSVRSAPAGTCSPGRARQRLATSAYAVVCYSICAVVIAVAAVVVDVPLAGFSARDWWLIAAITVVAQLLGHTVLNLVLSTVGPTVVSLAVLLEVPGSLMVALVLLDQAPPLLALPGMALSWSASPWWCGPAARPPWSNRHLSGPRVIIDCRRHGRRRERPNSMINSGEAKPASLPSAD